MTGFMFNKEMQVFSLQLYSKLKSFAIYFFKAFLQTLTTGTNKTPFRGCYGTKILKFIFVKRPLESRNSFTLNT